MSQSQDAWADVGEHLKSLGSKLRHHYRAQEREGRPEPASREEVEDALRTLGESVTAAFGTIGDAVTDPDVTAEARETAGAFLEALGASFSELGADVSMRSTDTATDSPEPAGDGSSTEPEPPSARDDSA